MTDKENPEVIEIKPTEIPKEQALTTPSTFIEMAVRQGLSVEHLERLMALKRQFDADEAKKAFDENMALFQSKCPIIQKTKKGGETKAGIVAYRYAPLEAIVEQVKDLLAECGFSYMIKSDVIETGVNVVCIVKHKQGHSEESAIKMPWLTKTGVMSDAQVVAATSTFAKRYAFNNAFGIMTADDDTDGKDDITESMKEEYKQKVTNWHSHDKIDKVMLSIETGTVYKDFLSKMPTNDDIKKFNELIAPKILVNQDDEAKYWDMLQTGIIKMKWKEYLTSLEKK